jgi:hypothetical protein
VEREGGREGGSGVCERETCKDKLIELNHLPRDKKTVKGSQCVSICFVFTVLVFFILRGGVDDVGSIPLSMLLLK